MSKKNRCFDAEKLLTYSLSELPSSQHRAGLAGLILLLTRAVRSNNGAVCEVAELTEYGATLRFNEQGIAAVFDEVYAATEELIPQESARKDQVAVKIEEREEIDRKTGKTKLKKFHYYPQVVPKGSFLEEMDTSQKKVWIKLHRDMLWSIMRGRDKQRIPFKTRADGKATNDWKIAWEQINAESADFVPLSSTHFIGAQEFNSECVSFLDKPTHQFLLHFWPFASQIFVPVTVDRDGKMDLSDYVICMPDICRLSDFCADYVTVLKNRQNDSAGFRPKASLVEIPEEAGLEMIRRLRETLQNESGRQQTADLIFGIDVFHMSRDVNNVRLRYSGRIEPLRSRDDEYSNLRNVLRYGPFRRQRLLNLVKGLPWYTGFEKVLCELPTEQGFLSPFFSRDARSSFELIANEEKAMTTAIPTEPVLLEPLILRIVDDYVRQKLRDKYNIEWKDAKGSPHLEKEYGDKKEAIGKEVFYAIRSRTDEDFRTYFASTLCSVPHWMSQAEFIAITKSLYDETDKVRTLSMIALSARVARTEAKENHQNA
jgi:CRISPR-associated protein Cmx8